MFAQQIDDWTFEHWTSGMRGGAAAPAVSGPRAALRDEGIAPNAAWSDATKFYLEVQEHAGSLRRAYVRLAEPGRQGMCLPYLAHGNEGMSCG